jgi:uncharacterized phage protein gp47/JayE
MTTTPVDYTSRDFDSIKEALLTYAKTAFPSWVPGSEGDFGVLLVELLSYVGDVNSYYIDRAQNEAYLPTATQSASILNIAQMLGYVPGTGAPAKGTVTFVASARVTAGAPPITIPAGTQIASDYVTAIDGQVIFETDQTVVLTPGDTVDANVTEGQTQKDPNTGGPIQVDVSTGLPDQVFRIPKPRVYVDTVTAYVAGTAWRKVDHLLDADANDQVFETFNDASGYTWLRFGDGLNGVVPAVGLDVSVIYRTGYGATGNLAAGQVTQVYSTDVPGIAIEKSSATSGLTTSTEMTGGADPETSDQVRNNAPKTFFTQQRAVTLDDFKNLAVSVPGVARASAVADYFSSVTVYIIGPDGNPPSQTLIDTTSERLNEDALMGVTVNVAAPTAVAVNIGATGNTVAVEVWPNFSRTAVQFSVEQAIKALLAFTSVDLGMKLTVGDVYKAITGVEGVRYVAIPLMARSDAAQTGTADIQFQSFEYPQAGNIVVTSTGGIG